MRHLRCKASAVKREKVRGYTLIELLVVIIIIGILLSLVAPATLGSISVAKEAKCRHNLNQLYNFILLRRAISPEDYHTSGWPKGIGKNFMYNLIDDLKEAGYPIPPDVRYCPLKAEHIGQTTYTGPTNPISEMSFVTAILLRDEAINHNIESGNVTIKSGATYELSGDDWNFALEYGYIDFGN